MGSSYTLYLYHYYPTKKYRYNKKVLLNKYIIQGGKYEVL